MRAFFDQNAPRTDGVRHGVSQPGTAPPECASHVTGWLLMLPFRSVMSAHFTSPLSRGKMPGVPAGTNIPNQPLASKPATPASSMVGTWRAAG